MYKVNLEIFEGPLDLLLFLIRKSEVDIHDIPISFLTKEYLEAVEAMQELDLNIAGEFLVMAAQLMLIKSRMLLPVDASGEDDSEEIEDPRAELVQRLLEYKQYKEAADQLRGMEFKQRDMFARLQPYKSMSPQVHEEDEGGLDVNLYDLLKAFQKILEELPENTVKEIPREEIKVVQKINEILDLLEKSESIAFTDVFKNARTRPVMIASFLAILELAKMGSIKIRQASVYADIRLYKGEGGSREDEGEISTEFDSEPLNVLEDEDFESGGEDDPDA